MPPKFRNPLAQECSVSVQLLKAWGVIDPNAPYSGAALLPVVQKYSGPGWQYRFGANLFEHISKAVTLRNQWVLPGPADPVSTLAEFLYKTTLRAHATMRTEVVAVFQQIAKRVQDCGEEIKFDHTVSAEENVERARRAEARHWAQHFVKPKGA